MADLEKIAEQIGKLSLLEAAELVKLLEDKLGVRPRALRPQEEKEDADRNY